MRIAYFVTPHGFGHAARAAAVMEGLARGGGVSLEILTTVPEWFFAQSLSVSFEIRPVIADVGLVQIDPLLEDLRSTVGVLEAFWSTLPERAEKLARSWQNARPDLVVCDISPLGLVAARRAGVPSVLVENFTWDWIYGAYGRLEPDLERFAVPYAELAAGADHRVQCRPVCSPASGAVEVAPVSREPRSGKTETRRALGIGDEDDRPLVLLTMGGLGWELEAPRTRDGRLFVALGGGKELTRNRNLIRLPRRSPVYPPDLVWAADAVVGKLGYSTVAECYRAGVRLGYVRRPVFPESPVLEAFVVETLPAIPLRLGDDAADGPQHEESYAELDRLLALPRRESRQENGADIIAAHLRGLLT